MKKYLKLFLVIVSFLVIIDVHAVTCKYKTISKRYSDNKKIKSQDSQVYSFNYSPSSRETIFFNNCKILNFYTDGNAFRMKEECPPYLSQLVDGVGVGSINGAGEKFECATFVETYSGAVSRGSIINNLNIDEDKADGLIYFEYSLIKSKSNESTTNEKKSCLDYGEKTCTTNDKFSCLWVTKKVGGKTVSYCNFDDLVYVRCGDAWDIPQRLPGIISFLVFLLKIATPLILIFVSIISLVKAIASSKEDEMKKAQNTLIRRLIAAGIIFFIVQITQFVVLKVADSSEKGNVATCMSCMLNNDCSKDTYYKTQVGSTYQCTFLNNTKKHCDCDAIYNKKNNSC